MHRKNYKCLGRPLKIETQRYIYTLLDARLSQYARDKPTTMCPWAKTPMDPGKKIDWKKERKKRIHAQRVLSWRGHFSPCLSWTTSFVNYLSLIASLWHNWSSLFLFISCLELLLLDPGGLAYYPTQLFLVGIILAQVHFFFSVPLGNLAISRVGFHWLSVSDVWIQVRSRVCNSFLLGLRFTSPI